MNENTTAVAPAAAEAELPPPGKHFTFKRNDVEVPSVETKIKRGDREGEYYYSIDINEKNLPSIINWLGADNAANWLQQKFNLLAQAASDDATDETTGELNDAKLIQIIQELSSRGETKEELETRRNVIFTDELPKFFKVVQDAMKTGQFTPEAIEAAAKVQKLQDEAIQINVAIERKKRERKPRTSKTAANTNVVQAAPVEEPVGANA
jgi:hypothetical protein